MSTEMEWFNAREKNMPAKSLIAEKTDVEVSKIVGFPVAMNDKRLIALVVKWKKQHGHEDKMDNHLTNPAFLTELKQVFK